MKFTNLVGFVGGLILGVALCVVLWAATITRDVPGEARYKAKIDSLEFELAELKEKYVELNSINTQNYNLVEECKARLISESRR